MAKSTLLNHISGLIKENDYEVFCFDNLSSALSQSAWSLNILFWNQTFLFEFEIIFEKRSLLSLKKLRKPQIVVKSSILWYNSGFPKTKP